MRKKFSYLFFVLSSFLSIPVASAQGLKNAVGSNSPLQKAASKAGADSNGDINTIVGTGIQAALTLVGIIFLVLMVYAGYLWMTARGDESQIEKAKGIISSTIIGLTVVLAAYFITNFVITKFGG